MASQVFGLTVAQFAGIPENVVARAKVKHFRIFGSVCFQSPNFQVTVNSLFSTRALNRFNSSASKALKIARGADLTVVPSFSAMFCTVTDVQCLIHTVVQEVMCKSCTFHARTHYSAMSKGKGSLFIGLLLL